RLLEFSFHVVAGNAHLRDLAGLQTVQEFAVGQNIHLLVAYPELLNDEDADDRRDDVPDVKLDPLVHRLLPTLDAKFSASRDPIRSDANASDAEKEKINQD